MNRVTHKRVTYCTGCDRFDFSETIACACNAQHAPVCSTIRSCGNCRSDLHPVFSEILRAFSGD